MTDKNEIERRKQIKKELLEKARLEFEQNLPIKNEILRELFDYLDEKLGKYNCDDSLKLTNEFLEEKSVTNISEVHKWLNENGGYCEVLGNVEEMFDENAIL